VGVLPRGIICLPAGKAGLTNASFSAKLSIKIKEAP